MILSHITRQVVKTQIQTLVAKLAVLIGSDSNVPATANIVLQDATMELKESADREFALLGLQILDGNVGLTWVDFQTFRALPFQEKVVFLVDKHTREFTAYWLMAEYSDIFYRLSDALEVVDDVCFAYWNAAPRAFPDPSILDMAKVNNA